MAYFKFINLTDQPIKLSFYGECPYCDNEIRRVYTLEAEGEIEMNLEDLIEVAIK
jgi:predicted DCC family thiol-disulfide oxidoreductase YuxK